MSSSDEFLNAYNALRLATAWSERAAEELVCFRLKGDGAYELLDQACPTELVIRYVGSRGRAPVGAYPAYTGSVDISLNGRDRDVEFACSFIRLAPVHDPLVVDQQCVSSLPIKHKLVRSDRVRDFVNQSWRDLRTVAKLVSAVEESVDDNLLEHLR